ncbi:MAG: SDR family oxidoreductase [Candidatus Marinimicrobia bacterium]|nr:SDR family oxidoreductase [Candidatus Neomarinimicrobiota bacterium]
MSSFRGKNVIITGASSGIGEACVRWFAQRGANVVLAARSIDKLEQICVELEASGAQSLAVQTDVTVADDVQQLFTASEEKFGPADIMINSAGSGLRASLLDISDEDWHSVMAANLTSVFYCSRAAAKQMIRANRGGHIITIGSVAGLLAAPNYAAYCAAKHGVTGFQRAIKWELRGQGIKVSTLYPARINSAFFKDYPQQPKRWQLLEPSDIAAYVGVIASGSVLRRAGVRLWLVVKRLYRIVRYLPFG